MYNEKKRNTIETRNTTGTDAIVFPTKFLPKISLPSFKNFQAH
jgi:hypothetical protein